MHDALLLSTIGFHDPVLASNRCYGLEEGLALSFDP